MKKVLLCIMDGIGLRSDKVGNAFLNANTKTIDKLFDEVVIFACSTFIFLIFISSSVYIAKAFLIFPFVISFIISHNAVYFHKNYISQNNGNTGDLTIKIRPSTG